MDHAKQAAHLRQLAEKCPDDETRRETLLVSAQAHEFMALHPGEVLPPPEVLRAAALG